MVQEGKKTKYPFTDKKHICIYVLSVVLRLARIFAHCFLALPLDVQCNGFVAKDTIVLLLICWLKKEVNRKQCAKEHAKRSTTLQIGQGLESVCELQHSLARQQFPLH